MANTGPHTQGLFDLYAKHVLPTSSEPSAFRPGARVCAHGGAQWPLDEASRVRPAPAPRRPPAVRLDLAAPRPVQAHAGRAAPPRRPGRAAHRRRQVGDLPDPGGPAARADRGDLTAAGPAAGSDRRAQRTRRPEDPRGTGQLRRDAAPAARGDPRDPRGPGRVPVHHAGAAQRPGPPGRGARPQARPGRGRRGALHLGLGSRLPARLPVARAPDQGHRPAAGAGADRHRLPAGARRHHRPAATCANPRSTCPAWTAATCSSRWRTARTRTTGGGG